MAGLQNPSIRALILRINEEWNRAEEAIKRAEQINNEVVTPAIKELRYTGRRIAHSLVGLIEGDSDDRILDNLSDALQNCFRARHDAVDAAVSKVNVDLEVVVERLGYDNCLACFPPLPELLSKVTQAQNMIAQSRGSSGGREEIYETLEAVNLVEIIGQYHAFVNAEKYIKARALKERRRVFGSYIVGAVGVLALFVTVAAWLFPK